MIGKQAAEKMGAMREINEMRIITKNIREKDFQNSVIQLAKLCGWLVYSTWCSIHSPSGFPDLVMVRLSRVIFAENKSEKGKLSPAQQEWLAALTATGKCEVYSWKPSDWDEIEKVLL